eukprot:8383449-Pyramimonas_sp.AAC.1
MIVIGCGCGICCDEGVLFAPACVRRASPGGRVGPARQRGVPRAPAGARAAPPDPPGRGGVRAGLPRLWR